MVAPDPYRDDDARTSGAGLDQPAFVGEDRGLYAVAEREFLEDLRYVCLDGRFAEDQRGGDLGVAESGGEHPQYRELPLGERGELRGAPVDRGGQPPRDLVEQLPGDGGGEERLAGGDGPHGVEQILDAGVLEDEAGCAGPERLDDVLVETERRQDQDPRSGQLPGRLDPVHAGHPDVHQHDIGQVAPRLLDRLLAGAGLGDDLDVAGALEQRFEPGAQQRLVVGDDHPQARVSQRLRVGQDRADAVPALLARTGADRAAEHRRALAHAAQSVTGGLCPGRGGGAVVLDRHLERVGPEAEADGRVRGTGVPAHVRQRLLDDPVGAQLEARREWTDRSLDAELDVESAPAALIGELLQVGERRLRGALGELIPAAQELERPVQLGHRVAPELGDRRRRPRAALRRRASSAGPRTGR